MLRQGYGRIHGLFNGSGLFPLPTFSERPSFFDVKYVPIFAALALGVALPAVDAAATQGSSRAPREQDNAYRATQQGRIMSLPEVRARVHVPNAQYIGAEMVGPTVYRLKYMRGADVIWIDIDARTGRIVSRRGM